MRRLIVRLRVLWSRIATLAARESLDAELTDELRFHHEMLTRDLREGGLSAADAEDAARRQLGNVLNVRERSADAWGFPALEQLWQDMGYGARLLRRSPGFAFVAIVAVGVAIGVNAGFFTLVDAFVWQPIPVARPQALVRPMWVDARNVAAIRFSYPQVLALSRARTISDVMAYDAEPIAAQLPLLTGGGVSTAQALSVGFVTGNYFTALGGQPAAGHLLDALDDDRGSPPAVVISDALWTRAYGRSPDVIGRPIAMNGRRATIVGVAEPGFIGLNPLVPDMWMSVAHAATLGLVAHRLDDPANRFLVVHARLRPAVSIAKSEGELSGLIAEPMRAGTNGDDRRPTAVRLTPAASMLPASPQVAVMIAPALFLVALLLVIACANLANLLLSRAMVRQREIAVRLALGASRWRVVRQLLTESATIAVAGAVLGVIAARWTVALATRKFLSAAPTTFGHVALEIHGNWHVVAYAAALASLSVLSFGLAPALQATVPNLTAALKGEDASLGGRVRRSRLRDALIAIEVAASVVLLAASAMLARGVHEFAAGRSGLRTAHVVTATIGVGVAGHPDSALAADRARFAAGVAGLEGRPIVARAAQTPFTSWPYVNVHVDGARAERRALPYNRVTPAYFDVVGQRIVDGRPFTPDDSASSADVVIVSAAAARAWWPSARAVGRAIWLDTESGLPRRMTVVGVAADARSRMLWDDDTGGYVFSPARAPDFTEQDMPLLVRVTRDDDSFEPALRRVATGVDANAPLQWSRLDDAYGRQVMPFQYGAVVTSCVGLLGLALALLGLYGVVSFSVRQRQREIAIRMAIGGRPGDVLRMVLRRELRIVCVGLLAGAALAIAEGKLIAALTMPIAGLGMLDLAGILGILLCVASVAILVPTRFAVSASPMLALRQD